MPFLGCMQYQAYQTCAQASCYKGDAWYNLQRFLLDTRDHSKAGFVGNGHHQAHRAAHVNVVQGFRCMRKSHEGNSMTGIGGMHVYSRFALAFGEHRAHNAMCGADSAGPQLQVRAQIVMYRVSLYLPPAGPGRPGRSPKRYAAPSPNKARTLRVSAHHCISAPKRTTRFRRAGGGVPYSACCLRSALAAALTARLPLTGCCPSQQRCSA